MKTNIFKTFLPAAAMLLATGFSSCTSDLDVDPISPRIDTDLNADELFNKCYATLALGGNGDTGSGDGNVDVTGFSDNGMTPMFRQMWNHNELTTDEAICSWGDDGVKQFNENSYDASIGMTKAYFSRLTIDITFCNQYIKVAGDLDKTKTAEIRFIRALQYYLLMDAFGNVPFAENIEKPVQKTRSEMYEWLVTEINDLYGDLSPAKVKKSSASDYVRATQGAADALLMRLYLNAEVYTGKAEWAKAKAQAEKLINGPYSLCTQSTNGWSAYQKLFMGDNGETDATQECIFPIYQDSKTCAGYGVSTFLSASTFNDKMMANPADPTGTNGLVSAQWGGNRARPDLIRKFFPVGSVPEEDPTMMPIMANDDRAIFNGKGVTLDVDKTSDFQNGFGVAKFIAYKTDGSTSADKAFSDADMFFFRLAEAYLTYAECDARLSGGTTTQQGTDKINDLRQRANASVRNNGGYSLDEILDEWSKEFYFEGRRRVDLVRFNKFGGNVNYNWQWKGGVKDGRNFEAYRNIFAIPTNELTSNSALVQNPGY